MQADRHLFIIRVEEVENCVDGLLFVEDVAGVVDDVPADDAAISIARDVLLADEVWGACLGSFKLPALAPFGILYFD